MELIKSDITAVLEMMEHLDTLAAVQGTFEVEIRFRTEGDDWITIGYGESGDPAVLKIEAVEPLAPVVKPNVFTINRQDVGIGFDRPLGIADYNTFNE